MPENGRFTPISPRFIPINAQNCYFLSFVRAKAYNEIMSKHIHDHETSGRHFRRSMTRWIKFFSHEPISLEDISVVQMSERSGTSYEARRDMTGGWSVYRIYNTAYDKTTNKAVHETQGVGMSLESALELLRSKSPEGMARRPRVYNHPSMVAKLIHYEFSAPSA